MGVAAEITGQECRLPGVGLADESDVGDELELQLERPRLAFLSGLPFAGRLMSSGGEEAVALAAPAALCDDHLLPINEDLGEDLAGRCVADYSAGRHRENHVLARLSALVRAHAVLAALRDPAIAVGIVEQRREIPVAANDDVAAASTVAAVRTAHRHAMLSAERRASRASGARFNSDYYAINEHRLRRVTSRDHVSEQRPW